MIFKVHTILSHYAKISTNFTSTFVLTGIYSGIFFTEYKHLATSDQPTVHKLLKCMHQRSDDTGHKVSVIGCGQVGMATVFAMLTQGTTNNVTLIDVNADKLKGELMDLQHGSFFMRNAKIRASTDYSITSGSKICIVTAGVRRRESESYLDLAQRNTNILKSIIPQLIKYSPDAIFVIASNPVDIMTYVTWKISGFPKTRVLGSGTNLDSARFCYLLSEKLGIAPSYCHGYIIGEHGDTSVPVWSGVNIAGVRLHDLNPKLGTDADSENWKDTHINVVKSAYEIVKLKGYTSWAIGLSLSQIAWTILANGEHDIKDEVFLSLPCVLGNSGVTDVVRQPLSNSELKQFRESAALMAVVQKGIKF